MTSVASTASMALMTSTASFHQKIYWSWWFDPPLHPNDQYQPLFVEWIIKNPIFHWYLTLFLSEAVEASRCNFFENWLKKHKIYYLLKPLGTINQYNYWSFYPSELIYFALFVMRHLVESICKLSLIKCLKADIKKFWSLGHLISFHCTVVRLYEDNVTKSFNLLIIFWPITVQLCNIHGTELSYDW